MQKGTKRTKKEEEEEERKERASPLGKSYTEPVTSSLAPTIPIYGADLSYGLEVC